MMEEPKSTENSRTVSISCKKCQIVFKVSLSEETLIDIEKFPFPIVLMHVSSNQSKELHTLIAYIDQNMNCRHVEIIVGKRLFITPYVAYNPTLLTLSCKKLLGQKKR